MLSENDEEIRDQRSFRIRRGLFRLSRASWIVEAELAEDENLLDAGFTEEGDEEDIDDFDEDEEPSDFDFDVDFKSE